MKYEIQIGQLIDFDTKQVRPETKLTITKEQFDIIRCFANTKKGKNLEMTYILNECEFTVVPLIEPRTPVTDDEKKRIWDYFYNLCTP